MLTKEVWISQIAEDPTSTLWIAADWFAEKGDKASEELCRWLLKRVTDGARRERFITSERNYIGPRNWKGQYWWFPFNAAIDYDAENMLPEKIFLDESDGAWFESAESAWAWAFERWHRAYHGGKFD